MHQSTCPSQALLIRLAAGELDDSEQDHLENHLAQCPHCRALLDSIHQVNAALDQWQPPVPANDLTDRVLAQTLARPSKHARLIRIAASLLLAGTMGFSIGRWTRPTPPAPAPDEDAVALALGLDTLAEQADLLGTVDFGGESR
jgi:anti-sigma factor RsiW